MSERPAQLQDAPRVNIEAPVMFYDTDCAGVVHNLTYLRHIETARTLLAEKLGWRLSEMAGAGQYPVVVRTEIDYKRPAKLGDTLAIAGWLDSVDKARFWCAFRLCTTASAAVLTECRQMLAVVQMPEGRVLRLPGNWQERWKLNPGAQNSRA